VRIVRDLKYTHQISNPAIRELVKLRIQDLSEQGFEIDEVGHFVLVDTTDTVATIEQHLGVPIGSYELMEAFPSCFDFVYLLDQSAGTGVELFVPKEEGIDADLLAMCRTYAYAAPPEQMP
jgi:hypothetical protein